MNCTATALTSTDTIHCEVWQGQHYEPINTSKSISATKASNERSVYWRINQLKQGVYNMNDIAQIIELEHELDDCIPVDQIGQLRKRLNDLYEIFGLIIETQPGEEE